MVVLCIKVPLEGDNNNVLVGYSGT